jgi:mRNA interferase RelE/StbE
MVWTVSLDRKAERQFAKLPQTAQLQTTAYLALRVAPQPEPRTLAKALKGRKQGIWRYRVGDYCLLCALRDKGLLLLVLQLGYRCEVYT